MQSGGGKAVRRKSLENFELTAKQDNNERNPDVSGRATRSARASLPADLSERMKEMRSK